MPGSRLLLVADPKMLPALATALRGGGVFDVLTVPISEAGEPGAQTAANGADAVAVFYGTADRPLAAALQALTPPVRLRGGRVIGVLQREQAGQRDECFRAGASDLLFMPLGKEQFVARLTNGVRLSYPAGHGIAIAVSVATRSATSILEGATVTPSGVHAPRALPLKPGETVRLSWDRFQTWGLVVQGVPAAQIRFAGLTVDEEAAIRDWLVGASASAPALASSDPAAGLAASPSATVPSPSDAHPALHADGIRAAPLAGPPPGFADRKPIRPHQARSPRVVPLDSTNGAAITVDPFKSLPADAASASPAILEPRSAPPLSSSPGAAPAEPPLAQLPALPFSIGPAWPVPFSAALCQQAAFCLLKDKTLPPDLNPEVAVATRKIVGLLNSTERAALDKAGPDSQFADALAARIALDAASSDGVRLSSNSPAAVLDPVGFAELNRRCDAAAARLQKEASRAITSGEVEQLQLVTAASAALSRDALILKATADRLRGIGVAPRLGGGALDPSLIIAGAAPRPTATKALPETAVVRAELRDFTALDDRVRSSRIKKIGIAALVVLFAVALVNALFFALPRVTRLSAEHAGAGVERIDVSGKSAMVTVQPAWVAAGGPDLLKLLDVLRSRGVEKAVLATSSGSPAGMLDVQEGKIYGLPKAGNSRKSAR